KGHVTLGVGGAAFAKIKDQPRKPWPPFPGQVPSGNENAVWLEPRLVCTVEFMHRTKNGGMRQPVFKGLRDDKAPTDCVAWDS
ncbi:MAG: DNA ligase, partial [Clostridia bacterium]|nr:DNA ligase [Clostridia bacterium]